MTLVRSMNKIVFLVIVVAVMVVLFMFVRHHNPSRATASSIDDPIFHINTPDKGYLNFPVRILSRSTKEALTFDPSQAKPATISYKLTRDGNIRIRVTSRRHSELVLRTLLDWTYQDFGPHEIKWDGKDASGNLLDNTNCFIDFKGDDPKHKEHKLEKCHELDMEVVSPSGEDTIRKLSDIRLKLTGDRAYGQENGYKLRTYIDYELAVTVSLEKDTTYFTLPDVDILSEGSHLITINIEDGHDHIGVASIIVNVKL